MVSGMVAGLLASGGCESDAAGSAANRLTVTALGDGTGVVWSTPAGILCTLMGGVATGDCEESFTSGTAVVLAVTPAAGGHAFADWSGACAGTASECTVQAGGALTVGARLTAPPTLPVYRLHGLDFGPYVDGQNPDHGAVVSAEQVRARLALSRTLTGWVRTFGSTRGLEHVGRIAHEMGLKVACGAWIGRSPSANQQEVSALVAAARAGHCDLAIVGSEALLRRDASEAQLLEYLAQVRSAVPSVPVTIADVHVEITSHPAVVAAVDVVLVNYYPYWEGVPLEHAVAHVHALHQGVAAAAGGKRVMVSETGWPSCGETRGAAVPSPSAAAAYLLNFVSWARALQVEYFYFEAFDEAWKAAGEGPQGACWGVMDRHGALKPGMQRVLDGEILPDNWSGGVVPGGPGTPFIELTYVPPYGSFDDLRGRVLHVSPADHRVVVYIRVGGGWWIKPYLNAPKTLIRPDGTWTTDITTGGVDQDANAIAAFLIPATYDPPLSTGQGTLPAALNTNALASVTITRTP